MRIIWQANDVDSSFIESLVKAIVALAAFGTLLATLGKDHHPLIPIERLTALTDKLKPGPTRDALIEHRDQAAAQWLLRQRAPQVSGMRWLAISMSLSSMTISIAWLILTLTVVPTSVTFIIYAVALGLALGAQVPAARRQKVRKDWMRQEAQWRGLSIPDEPTKVVHAKA